MLVNKYFFMLSDKHKHRLLNAKLNADHLLRFINKWVTQEHIPDHIAHMLTKIAEMNITEQQYYHVYRDELYYIKYDKTNYKKYCNAGWRKMPKYYRKDK